MNDERLIRDAVLRIGEATKVTGQTVEVKVDKNKNASDLLFDGDVLRNIAVSSYVEIRKGFITLIGKVDGERLDEIGGGVAAIERTDRNRRFLDISLVGSIDPVGKFRGGLLELPLIGNEVFLVDKGTIRAIHNLVEDGRSSITFGVTEGEGLEIEFPVDGLFNSHIAIFGNTGSGKSNTLASLYSAFTRSLTSRNRKDYRNNVRVILLDFNGEFTGKDCITSDKHVYDLSTAEPVDLLPVGEAALADLEMLAILSDATEKTQKPFLKRVLDLNSRVFSKKDPNAYFRAILKRNVEDILRVSDKQRGDHLVDHMRAILPDRNSVGEPVDILEGITWHNKFGGFYKEHHSDVHFAQHKDEIQQTTFYKLCEKFQFSDELLSRLIVLMYAQLAADLLKNRAQNEHIAPVINRLAARRDSITKIFDTSHAEEFWKKNFVVVSLDKVNLDMRKTVPLLLAKKLYQEHKKHRNSKSLTIVIDEAHNILSTESFREAESWKDYRLETFEEIIKEGRKFGVFVTISSQRPNDISPTITSQAHNYFVHRLVNQRDLATISSAVSFIDRVSEAAIPTLPVGTCIFSGVAGQMPLKIKIPQLAAAAQPRSATLKFDKIVPSKK